MGKPTDDEAIELISRRVFTGAIVGLTVTLREQQLSVAQMATLFLLSERSPQTLSEVAATVGLSTSAASRMVDGLVKSGLVVRREAPQDRRQRLLSLTRAGERLIERASLERVQLIKSAIAQLPPHLERPALRALKALVGKRIRQAAHRATTPR